MMFVLLVVELMDFLSLPMSSDVANKLFTLVELYSYYLVFVESDGRIQIME